MTDPQCALCPRPAPDAPVCTGCAIRSAGQLREAADLWPALRDQVARQVRAGDPTPRAGRPAPPEPIRPDGGRLRHYADQEEGWPTGLPVDLAASEVADALRNTATTWARHIKGERGQRPPAGMAALLRWLAGQCEWLRHRPEGSEALDELAAAAGTVWRAVDRATVERHYLGPCDVDDCEGELSARSGAAEVTCPACGISHQVAERRRWLDGLVMGRCYTAAEIADAYPQISAERIRKLASRGQVTQHGRDRLGRPLYLLREVLDWAARVPSKRERMAA